MSDMTKEIEFLAEIDRMKFIMRQTPLHDGSRFENDAEHSWHMAMCAMVLRQYAPEGCDCDRAARMALVHDLVEIYAGDTYAYDDAAHSDKSERETNAADKLFGGLPEDLGADLRGLWKEFEACETPTAKYACACDRIQPLLLNYQSGGLSWTQHGVHISQVLKRNVVTFEALPGLEPFIRALLNDAVKRGWLLPD